MASHLTMHYAVTAVVPAAHEEAVRKRPLFARSMLYFLDAAFLRALWQSIVLLRLNIWHFRQRRFILRSTPPGGALLQVLFRQ